jgi:hypothetical protein
MSVDEFIQFVDNQKQKYAELQEAKKKYEDAQRAFYESCIVNKKPVVELRNGEIGGPND